MYVILYLAGAAGAADDGGGPVAAGAGTGTGAAAPAGPGLGSTWLDVWIGGGATTSSCRRTSAGRAASGCAGDGRLGGVFVGMTGVGIEGPGLGEGWAGSVDVDTGGGIDEGDADARSAWYAWTAC